MHRAYDVALAHAIADDGDAAWLGEQDAWDARSEEADRLSLCLTCEAHSSTHAYCEAHRLDGDSPDRD